MYHHPIIFHIGLWCQPRWIGKTSQLLIFFHLGIWNPFEDVLSVMNFAPFSILSNFSEIVCLSHISLPLFRGAPLSWGTQNGKHFYLQIWGTYSKSEEGFLMPLLFSLNPIIIKLGTTFILTLWIYDEWLKDGGWWKPKVNKLAYKYFPKFSQLACILSLTY